MKVRADFITNSSSSSYICGFCGNHEEGMDLCMTDAGFITCENDHSFCDVHLMPEGGEFEGSKLEEELVGKYLKDHKEFDEDEAIYELRYQFPPEHCPFCQLKLIMNDDYVDFVTLILDISKEDVLENIRVNLGSYPAFAEALRAKQMDKKK